MIKIKFNTTVNLYKLLLLIQAISLLILFFKAQKFQLLQVGQLLYSYIIYDNFKKYKKETEVSRKMCIGCIYTQIFITVFFSIIFYFEGEYLNYILLYLFSFFFVYLIFLLMESE